MSHIEFKIERLPKALQAKFREMYIGRQPAGAWLAPMRKSLLALFVLAGSFVWSGLARAQTSAGVEPAATRSVKRHVLTSTYLPAIRIRFDGRFKYLGSQQFILYERARVEQHFFVEADRQRRIRRMYMLQFEGYLPGIKGAYDYPLTETVQLDGETYLVNVESIPSLSAVLKQNPQSDVAHAASFLEGKGYHVGESVMYQRFVRLVDTAKRHEFILLYVEDADAGASSVTDAARRDFSRRALQGFTVLR